MDTTLLATAAFFARPISCMAARDALGAAIDLHLTGDIAAFDAAPATVEQTTSRDQGLRAGHGAASLLVTVLALWLASQLGVFVTRSQVEATIASSATSAQVI